MTNASDLRDVAIRRIKALLAKAEGTNHPAEAEAFFAKAAELMEKYRIEEGAVRDEDLEFVRRKYNLAAHPYLRASLALLNAIGKHYAVVVIVGSTGNSKQPTLAGDDRDIDSMLMMFESLMIQRARAVASEPVPPGTHPNAFRNSFCYGYAVRINERLKEIRAAAKDAARTEGNSMALAVYDRLPAVYDFLQGTISKGSHNRPRVDGNGMERGDAAGARADLGQTRVGASGPIALGR